jgi:fructose-1,6-bisphosphatase/inositol monophosphatase family enzyme
MRHDPLVAIAHRAGEMALGYYGRVVATMKADRTWVTEADEAVERFICGELSRLEPHWPIISEEGYAHGVRPRLSQAEFGIAVDPIDGTAVFIEEVPLWSISIGILRHGLPYMGVVHLPVLNETYSADERHSYRNDKPLKALATPPLNAESVVLVPSNFHRRYDMGGFIGKVRSLGSTAYHLVLVAKGAAVAALCGGGTHIWDIAGGLAVAARNGVEARFLDGTPLDTAAIAEGGIPRHPFLVAPPDYQAAVAALVRRRS